MQYEAIREKLKITDQNRIDKNYNLMKTIEELQNLGFLKGFSPCRFLEVTHWIDLSQPLTCPAHIPPTNFHQNLSLAICDWLYFIHFGLYSAYRN